MRSLTCKSHSASSKRAIIGRSKDYDILLTEFIVNNPGKIPQGILY
jgi:SAGA-associated factor 73